MLKEINTVTEFCAKSGTSKEILDVNVFIQLIPMDENGAIIGGYGPTLCDRADLRDNKGDKITLSFRKEKIYFLNNATSSNEYPPIYLTSWKTCS